MRLKPICYCRMWQTWRAGRRKTSFGLFFFRQRKCRKCLKLFMGQGWRFLYWSLHLRLSPWRGVGTEMGDRMPSQDLTCAFSKFLEKHGLRRMRFQDLRHGCASILLSNGIPMKQIQEWLYHSDFSTTANVYAHLDYNPKLSSVDAMVNELKEALNAIQ